ncbi:MAG: SAM-dependent chlorinase/fluorinase [Planctomycetota bacterium]
MSQPIITLLTDFGTRDSYAAQMKGVILGINPRALIIDISHDIEPQAIMRGAICLDEAFDAFPDGTIHVVIVDPDVGTTRRRIAAEIGNQRYVGPDNGLLTLLTRRHPVRRVHNLSSSKFHRQPLCATFHGRDLFSPVAAHWSLGTDLSEFGDPVTAPLAELRFPKIEKQAREILGEVLAIDRFGNITSNIRATDLPMEFPATIFTHIGGQQLNRLSNYYSEHPPGAVLALIGSSGRLEVARNLGNAAETLQVTVGDEVYVKW